MGAINFLGQPGFDFYNTDFQTNVGTPPLPHFGLITTNRFQACILDTDTNQQCHVIDYVHFAGPDTVMDVNTNLADPDYVEGGLVPAYLWSTNGFNGGSTPWGVVNQIVVSQGAAAPPLGGRWEAPPNFPNYLPRTPLAEQVFFTGFFNVNRLQPGVYLYNSRRYTNTALACQAPFTPTRIVYHFTTWQANDPLIHYLVSDLNDNLPGITGVQHSDDLQVWTANLNINLTNINRRYSPWGHAYPYPAVQQSTDATWLTALKDPLMWRSDNWNFPTGPDWPVTTLGRVHRGTPWQTVYLKSADILAAYYGMSSWAQWVGASSLADITNSAPVKDWQLSALILPLMNTNDPTQLLSINDANQTNWLDRLNRVMVLSNSAAGDPFYYFAPGFDLHTLSTNPGQSGQIADAIAVTRLNQPNGAFQSAGDLLSLTSLTENAPWLNWADSAQLKCGISDEAYEAMPSQLLPLLRQDSIGAVAKTNGIWAVRFSGVDGYSYALQTSTDLVNWTTVSTNEAVRGSFTAPAGTAALSGCRYYRSVLLP